MKTQDNDAKRVGIWVRVSTEDQVRGESPETHERRARLYAEAKGWNVVEVYRLDAVSGKTVRETPEAKRMLADIKDGHITGLIFSKLARLARNTKELLEFSEFFREYGADLISLAESIDTSTPAGRLFYTMIAAMAQWEREEISARVAAAVPIRAQAGKPTGGQAPYGYQWKDKELLIDPKEAPVRKLMFELFRDCKRKKQVARMLNEQGYRTRNGGKFSDTTVDRLIRDPIAKGLRRANYTTNPTSGGKGAWILKPESEWVHLEVEPIVSEELWTECNYYLTEQRTKRKRVAKPAVHLFSGVTYCHCGQKMYVPSDTRKYTCQKCRNKIPLDDLEAVFHAQIKHFLFSDQEISAHLEQANETMNEKVELLGVLERDAEKLAREIDKLYDLYQSGMIDKAGFGQKYKPLAERRAQLDDQIPALQAEIDVLKIAHLSQEAAIEESRDLHSRWPTLPKEEKRRIVEAIVERITIGDGEVEITLYYTPPPPAKAGGGGSASNQGGKPPSSPKGSENRSKLATNPCPCGYLGVGSRDCECSAEQVRRYRERLSGPLLDRFDMRVEVSAPDDSLFSREVGAEGESSAAIRERVIAARERQITRQGINNAALQGRTLEECAELSATDHALLVQAVRRFGLSARAYHRILRVARSIADYEDCALIGTTHVAEALAYRIGESQNARR